MQKEVIMNMLNKVIDTLQDTRDYVWDVERKRTIATLSLFLIIVATALSFEFLTRFWSGMIAGLLSFPAIVSCIYIFNLISAVLKVQSVSNKFLNDKIPTAVKHEKIERAARKTILSYSTDYFGHHFNNINDVEIEWVKDGEKESTQEVLCISDRNESGKNLAQIMVEFANNGVIPDSRGQLRPDVSTSLSCYVAEDILDTAGKEEAADYIRDNLLFEEIEDKEVSASRFSDSYTEISNIHEEGLLGSILLTEYKQMKNDPANISELRDNSAKLLENLSKLSEEEVQFEYMSDYFEFKTFKISKRHALDDKVLEIARTFGGSEHRVVYVLALGGSKYAAKKVYQGGENLPGASEEDSHSHEYVINNDKYGRTSRFFGRIKQKEEV